MIKCSCVVTVLTPRGRGRFYSTLERCGAEATHTSGWVSGLVCAEHSDWTSERVS